MENALHPTSAVPTPGDPNAPSAEQDLSGKTVGDYRVLRRLGQGGMGQVYLAEQLSLKRKVALKVMRADLAANPVALQRFRAEAQAAARVTHTNIVQVYAIEVLDGLHCMSLEYVEGRTLRDFIAKKGPPDLPVALSIMRQVAAALQQAHDAGIIHRDIKPENILLTRKGEAKVADFGLSRCFGADSQAVHLTQSGVSMGTPLYMSPEQVQSKEVDPRTDIYSFGVTCYHMLAGEPPYRGQSAFDVAIQHVQGQPTPLQDIRSDLPIEVCNLIHRMMAKNPDERIPSSRDLVAEIVRLRQGFSGGAGARTQDLDLGQSMSPGEGSTLPPAVTKTVALPAAGATGRGRAVLVLTVLLALGAGAGLHVWRSQAAARLPVSTELSAAGEAVRLTSTNGSREVYLLETYKKEVNLRGPDEIRRHLDATLQLGILYLDQRRLGEADAFFQELRENPPADVKFYHAYGRIGQAVILAFRDKAEESNSIFLEVEKNRAQFPKLGEKGRPPLDDPKQWVGRLPREFPAEFMLLSNPQVWRVVVEALNRNAANLGDTAMPSSLERMRKLPNAGKLNGPGAK